MYGSTVNRPKKRIVLSHVLLTGNIVRVLYIRYIRWRGLRATRYSPTFGLQQLQIQVSVETDGSSQGLEKIYRYSDIIDILVVSE